MPRSAGKYPQPPNMLAPSILLGANISVPEVRNPTCTHKIPFALTRLENAAGVRFEVGRNDVGGSDRTNVVFVHDHAYATLGVVAAEPQVLLALAQRCRCLVVTITLEVGGYRVCNSRCAREKQAVDLECVCGVAAAAGYVLRVEGPNACNRNILGW